MYHRYYYITDDMLEDEIADFKENGTRAEVVKKKEQKLNYLNYIKILI